MLNWKKKLSTNSNFGSCRALQERQRKRCFNLVAEESKWQWGTGQAKKQWWSDENTVMGSQRVARCRRCGGETHGKDNYYRPGYSLTRRLCSEESHCYHSVSEWFLLSVRKSGKKPELRNLMHIYLYLVKNAVTGKRDNTGIKWLHKQNQTQEMHVIHHVIRSDFWA